MRRTTPSRPENAGLPKYVGAAARSIIVIATMPPDGRPLVEGQLHRTTGPSGRACWGRSRPRYLDLILGRHDALTIWIQSPGGPRPRIFDAAIFFRLFEPPASSPSTNKQGSTGGNHADRHALQVRHVDR